MPSGKQLAFNDDFEDKGAGLQTHYADSYFRATLPAAGAYYLYLGDAQHQGGPEYAYRLRLSPPRPDFALRVVPSSLAVRGGMSVPLTVYALRRDGFSNAITLALKDAPAGFKLSGGAVPTNQDQVRLSLAAPAQAEPGILKSAWKAARSSTEQQVVRPGGPGGRHDAGLCLPASGSVEGTGGLHPGSSPAQARLAIYRLRLRPNPRRRQRRGEGAEPPAVAFTNNFQLELNAPPDGISIENVSSVGTELEILLHSDAAKIKPGAKGNLIVNIMAKRQPAARPAAGPRQPAPPRPRRPPRHPFRNRRPIAATDQKDWESGGSSPGAFGVSPEALHRAKLLTRLGAAAIFLRPSGTGNPDQW